MIKQFYNFNIIFYYVKDGGDEKQADGTGEPEVEAEEEDIPFKKPKKVPNQFNFCERATLTYNNPIRVGKKKLYSSFKH